MNPAALKANAAFMNPGGTIIFDVDSFSEKNFAKAQFQTLDPFAELKLDDYFKIPVPITSLTKKALKIWSSTIRAFCVVKTCLPLA